MKLCRFPPLNWKCERKPVILQCPTLCSEGIFTANSSPFFGEFHHPWPPSFSSRKTSSCLPDGPEYLAHQIGTASLGSYTAPQKKKKTWFPFIPLLPCDDGSEIAIFQAGHLRGQHPRNLPHWLVLWFGPPRDPKVLGAPSKVNPEIPTVFIGQNGGIHEPMVI